MWLYYTSAMHRPVSFEQLSDGRVRIYTYTGPLYLQPLLVDSKSYTSTYFLFFVQSEGVKHELRLDFLRAA